MVSVGIELLAMSSLMPLSSLITGGKPEDSFIAKIISQTGLNVEPFTLLITFVALFTLRILTQILLNGLNIYYSRELLGRLSSDALKTILSNYSLTEIESKSMGHYNSLAGDEANRSSQILLNLLTLSGTLTLSLFYALAIYVYSVKTFIAIIIFFTLCLLLLWGCFVKSYRLGQLHIEESKRTNSIFIDAMSNIRMIRSFKSESYVSEQYYTIISKYMNTLFKVDFLNIVSKLFPVFILLSLSCFYFIAKSEAIKQGVNIAFFITIIFYLLRFLPAVGMCLTSLLRIISDAKAGKDIVSVVERVGEKDKRILRLEKSIETIRIENVSFSYDQKKSVLDEFSYYFEAGKIYALVGPSGVGKSTLANLLLGFYELDKGSIFLNDVPISEISRDSLRGKILLLGQKAVAFNDTIHKNITFGSDMEAEDLWECLEKVDLKETIKNLPRGLETELQYQGTNLSGGQLQRIGIARALLRNPDVVLFDESFSGLDSVTKMKILNNIKKFGENKILIFITHDQQIMSFVDKIIDLEKPHKSKEICEEIHETTR